jgi:hypothetical protein
MSQELKIIVGNKYKGEVKIFVGDTQIGLIQDIKFHAQASSITPNIEIMFPDLFDDHYKGESLKKSLSLYMELLKDVPGVTVTLLPLCQLPDAS